MDKKYKLLKDDTIEYGGKTLYRIQALKDINNILFDEKETIKKGSLGGYIESEELLPQYDFSWVGDNAKVLGDIKLENTWVTGNTVISGSTFNGSDKDYSDMTIKITDSDISNTSIVGSKINIISSKAYNKTKIGSVCYISNTTIDNSVINNHCKVVNCTLKDSEVTADTIVIASNLVKSSISEGCMVTNTKVYSSKIECWSKVINSELKGNCRVSSKVVIVDSQLEKGVKIRNDALITNTTMVDNVYLSNNSIVVHSDIRKSDLSDTSWNTQLNSMFVNSDIRNSKIVNGIVENSKLQDISKIKSSNIIDSDLKNFISIQDEILVDSKLDYNLIARNKCGASLNKEE